MKYKTVGFPISPKENERRRAIVPADIGKLAQPGLVFVEQGYGGVLGIPDEAYLAAGARIGTHEETLRKDIVCDPKIGDASYLDSLKEGQTIFGWVHATQNRAVTDMILSRRLTAYAWENMFEWGRHVFWFNNELAGEAAVYHAFQVYGTLPLGLDVAVIGNGNTARGACRMLNMLGARVMQYTRNQELLLRAEIGRFDAVVNCVLWDVTRKDHIVYRRDLMRMKRNAMIVDVSCDRHGGIETCVPTTMEEPTYMVDGILHYAVDHTPSFFYKTFSYQNSAVIQPFIDQLMAGQPGQVLKNALVLENGAIVDQDIIAYQGR